MALRNLQRQLGDAYILEFDIVMVAQPGGEHEIVRANPTFWKVNEWIKEKPILLKHSRGQEYTHSHDTNCVTINIIN